MKKLLVIIFILSLTAGLSYSQEDKFYTESGGELIFSFAEVEREGQSISTPVRFSMFLHLGQNFHWNFSNYAGLYSGYYLRNVGFITEENDIKTKRRTYSFGIPLALKIGVMDKNLFIYGGGSYELYFHYKQKQFIGGEKSKFSEWFSPRTERFAPALFAGVQFPGGINLKFKYYPGDFLNRDFEGRDFGQEVDYSDYNKTNLFYVALSFNIRPKKIKDTFSSDAKQIRYVMNNQ